MCTPNISSKKSIIFRMKPLSHPHAHTHKNSFLIQVSFIIIFRQLVGDVNLKKCNKHSLGFVTLFSIKNNTVMKCVFLIYNTCSTSRCEVFMKAGFLRRSGEAGLEGNRILTGKLYSTQHLSFPSSSVLHVVQVWRRISVFDGLYKYRS